MSDNNWKTSCHHMSICALTGASAFFASIPGSFMLVNGPLWCYFYAMKYVEDYDASALRRFHCTQPEGNSLVYGTEKDLLAGIDFVKESVPDETTLCKFRHLLEEHGLNKLFFDAITRVMVETGHIKHFCFPFTVIKDSAIQKRIY